MDFACVHACYAPDEHAVCIEVQRAGMPGIDLESVLDQQLLVA